MKESFFGEFEYPSYNDWKDEAIKALKGAPFDKKMFTNTYEEITLEPIYTEEVYNRLINQISNLPGYSPFVRAANHSGKILHSWDITQKMSYPLPVDFNQALHKDLNSGLNSILLEFKNLIDRNDEISEKVTNINSLQDFEIALKDIDITKYPIYLKNTTSPIVSYYLLESYCKKNNIAIKDINGLIFNDLIAILLQTGELQGNFYCSFDEIAKYFDRFKSSNLKLITIDSKVLHNGGANIIDEIAYSLSSLVFTITELMKRNIDIDILAPKIAFSTSIGTNFFMEIAKLRALRILWSKIISEFGGNENSQKLFIHAETSLRESTKYDPWVNMLRATTEAFSAILGGSDSITVNNFDVALGLPSDFSRRTARNTQNVLKYESHLNDTIDPVGGSWYIETLTNQIAEKVWIKFQNIELQGGILNVIDSKKIHDDIHNSFINRKKNLSIRKDTILGTNKYPNVNEKKIDNLYIPDHMKISEYKSGINFNKSAKDVDTVDRIINGEILSNILSCNLDGKVTSEIIPLRRSSEIFENLREASESFTFKHGYRPKVNLVCWGLLKEYKPRADFATDFFQVGGFDTQQIGGFKDFDDMAKSLIDFDESIFVFCSTDEKYEEFIIRIASLLKKSKPFSKLILAGLPANKIEEYKEAGIDEFIHLKANIYNVLNELQNDLGINIDKEEK